MAAGRIVVASRMPALDLNGTPISGALLKLYVNNTTTLTTIYADEALSVPLTNPVAADSGGNWPQMWQEAGTEASPTLYSLALTDADGVPLSQPSVFDDFRPSVDYDTATVALAETAATAAAAFYADILAIEATGSDAAAIATRASKAANLSDLEDAAEARENIGATATGEAVFMAASSLAARSAIAAAGLSQLTGSPGDQGATANGTADDRAAILAAQAAYDTLNLISLSGGSTYRMETAVEADFSQPIYAAEGVTLSLPSSLGGGTAVYANLAALKPRTALDVTFRDAGFSNRFGPEPDPWLKPLPGLLSGLRKWSAAQLGGSGVVVRSNTWPGSDTWSDITPAGATSADVSFVTDNGFNGVFASIGVGETLRQTLKSFSGDVTSFGVVVRGSGGFAVIFNGTDESDALAWRAFKLTGDAVDQAQVLEYPNRGVNDTFAFNKVEWAVTRTAADRVLVKMNGVGVTITGRGIANVGDIQEVGFAVYSGGGATVTVSGHVVEKSDELIGMLGQPELVVFGDSTAEDMASCWTRDLPALMDGFQGVTLGPVSNLAVVSTTTAQALTAMASGAAFGDAELIGVCTGTNDIQLLTDRATFSATVQSVCTLVGNEGRQLVWQIPYLWYGQADAGGTGFGATNADEGAWYRNEIMRIVAASGFTYVDTAGHLGNPDPTQRLEPRGGGQLRDNIHQTSKGHQLYAVAFAKAALSAYCALPDSYSSALTDAVLEAGVTITSGVPYGYDVDGATVRLYGLIDVTTITNGTALMTLPRHLRPTRDIRARTLAFDAGSAPLDGNPYLNINTDGEVSLQGAPGGTVRLDLGEVVIQRPA